jgi:hypothetical protein
MTDTKPDRYLTMNTSVYSPKNVEYFDIVWKAET